MSVAMTTSRTQLWMENLGEWSWPGSGGAAVEVLPPSWVPTFPPRLERATGVADAVSAPGAWQPQRGIALRLGRRALLSLLAMLCAVLALGGLRQVRSVERSLGTRAAGGTSAELLARQAVSASTSAARSFLSLPSLQLLSQD